MKKFQNFDQGKGLYSLDPKRNSDASPNQFFIVVPRSAIKLFFSFVKIIQKKLNKSKQSNNGYAKIKNNADNQHLEPTYC